MLDKTQRSAGEEGRRHHHLHARRRPCARRLAAADQHRARQRRARGADDDPEDRLGLDARRHRRASSRCCRALQRDACRQASDLRAVGDQSIFVKAAVSGVMREAALAAALTGLMILLFLGSWRSTLIIADLDPAGDPVLARPRCRALGETHQRDDAGRAGARGRHSGRRRAP